MTYSKHQIEHTASIKEALAKLDILAQDAILFVTENNVLVGSLTDGDIRRALLRGIQLDETVIKAANTQPKYLIEGENQTELLEQYREKDYKIVPVVSSEKKLLDVINFRITRSRLPIEVVIMAGGKGERLRPLTENTPKPLLPVGDKPIMQHNLDAMKFFGIKKAWISVNYLAEQIEDFVQEYATETFKIETVKESFPMGTIGSIQLIPHFESDYILVSNSDLLTNVDYEQFFDDFIKSGADLSVVSIPYNVDVPYAIFELNDGIVKDFKEKPTYTYFANGGIYLMHKDVLKLIPPNQFFTATDLMESLLEKGKKIRSYPHQGYWLDIGKHEDYKRASEDIKNLKLF